MGRSQRGNNNGYCQDGPLTWHHWKLEPEQQEFLEFARRVVTLRRNHPNFRRHSYREQDPQVAPMAQGLDWFRPDGERMEEDDWQQFWVKSLGVYLRGDADEIRDENGHPVPDDDFLIFFNAHHEGVSFELSPELERGWTVVFDTEAGDLPEDGSEPEAIFPFILGGRSLVLLRHVR